MGLALISLHADSRRLSKTLCDPTSREFTSVTLSRPLYRGFMRRPMNSTTPVRVSRIKKRNG